MSVLEQLRRNQLAIISLIVALTALGYNTWRNELTEENRTVRQAGFEMVVHVSDLQRIAYLAHYDSDPVGGNPRKGWAEVLVLQDLSVLMPDDVQEATAELATAWGENWAQLGNEATAIKPVDDAIDALRDALRETLDELD